MDIKDGHLDTYYCYVAQYIRLVESFDNEKNMVGNITVATTVRY